MRTRSQTFILASLSVTLLAIAHAVPAAAGLVSDLQSDEPTVRIAAAQRLAGADFDPADCAVLAEALRDPYHEVRTRAARALGGIGAPAVADIISSLKHEHYYGPLYGAMAAGALDPEAASGELIEQLLAVVNLDSCDQMRQAMAAAALARLDLAEAGIGPELRAAYEAARDACVRKALSQALARTNTLDPAMIPGLIARLGSDPTADRLLCSFGAKAVPGLVDRLETTQSMHRRFALVGVIGNLGPDAAEAVPVLIAQLQNTGDRWYAALIARQLGLIGPRAEAAVPALIDTLCSHKYDGARAAAAEALGHIGKRSDDALAALKAATEDLSDVVKEAAAESLRMLKR